MLSGPSVDFPTSLLPSFSQTKAVRICFHHKCRSRRRTCFRGQRGRDLRVKGQRKFVVVRSVPPQNQDSREVLFPPFSFSCFNCIPHRQDLGGGGEACFVLLTVALFMPPWLLCSIFLHQHFPETILSIFAEASRPDPPGFGSRRPKCQHKSWS